MFKYHQVRPKERTEWGGTVWDGTKWLRIRWKGKKRKENKNPEPGVKNACDEPIKTLNSSRKNLNLKIPH